MHARLVRHLAILAFAFTDSQAIAVVIIFTSAAHDNPIVRSEVANLPEMKEWMLHVSLIERFAVADRARPVADGLSPPQSREPMYEALRRGEIEKGLGRPVTWNAASYVRPVAGRLAVNLGGPRPKDLEPELPSAFYELPKVGGILVYFSTDGAALSPAIVYLRTDEQLTPMRRMEDLVSRLHWEIPKLKRLKEWLQVPEQLQRSDDGVWQIVPGVANGD